MKNLIDLSDKLGKTRLKELKFQRQLQIKIANERYQKVQLKKLQDHCSSLENEIAGWNTKFRREQQKWVIRIREANQALNALKDKKIAEGKNLGRSHGMSEFRKMREDLDGLGDSTGFDEHYEGRLTQFTK